MNRIYNQILQKFDPRLCGLFQNHKPSCVVIELAISSLEHTQSQVLQLTNNVSWQTRPSIMVMKSTALSEPAKSATHTLIWCDKGLDKKFWLTEECSPCHALELSDRHTIQLYHYASEDACHNSYCGSSKKFLWKRMRINKKISHLLLI